MEGDLIAASEARDTLLRLHVGYSITWMHDNQPFDGEMADRIGEGLRRVGIFGVMMRACRLAVILAAEFLHDLEVISTPEFCAGRVFPRSRNLHGPHEP